MLSHYHYYFSDVFLYSIANKFWNLLSISLYDTFVFVDIGKNSVCDSFSELDGSEAEDEDVLSMYIGVM